MSVIRNLSRLIWYVPKYLRLFVETYPQILWQKYLDTFCYPYRCLNLARPRKKFNFFIRFYYYSDSNIKVKFCEDPPSSQPCPFFLQRTGQRLFLDLTDGLASMHSTLYTEKCALNRETILLLLRILFQFQHVLIKIRHK